MGGEGGGEGEGEGEGEIEGEGRFENMSCQYLLQEMTALFSTLP